MLNLAIIIPMYNPHTNWYEVLCNSISELDSIISNVTYSVVLVNDGSSIFNESYVEELKSGTHKINYVSYEENQGKGYAIRYGLSKVQADYYIYTDIDFPFGYEVIPSIYQILISSSTNLVVGLRDKKYFKQLPFRRKVISKALHNINYVLTGFKVHDTQAGIKGFDNEAKMVMLSTITKEFLFDLEFIRGCLRRKLNFSFINIHPRDGIKFTDFRAKVIIQEIRNLIKILLSN